MPRVLASHRDFPSCRTQDRRATVTGYQEMNHRFTWQTRIACLLLAFVACTPNAVARGEVERFDNGPFFSETDEFITASSSVLNKAENSPIRLFSVALVQRAAGGRAAHQRDVAARTVDELARYYIVSVDGWTTNSALQKFAQAFSQDPGTKNFASALRSSIQRLPDGKEITAPVGQRISLFYGDMLITGGALLKKGTTKDLAGRYKAQVTGDCSFDDGPVEIFQDKFLLEGRRDQRLLFWGAIGDTRAYFAAAENKYLKITLKRRGKVGQVEFPERASELFSALIDKPALSLKGELFGDCEITLTPQVLESDTLSKDERQPTRLVQQPPVETIERVDTPSVGLTMQEVKRSGTGSKLEVTYKFVAKGFPAGSTYSLWRYKPQPKPVRILGNLSVDEFGVMIANECGCAEHDWTPAPLDTAIPMIIDTIAPGEPFEFGIVSEDQSVQAFATVFPIPMEFTDNNCRLVLERLNPGQTAYRAYATGLAPGEALRFESESGDVVLHDSSQADANGEFSAYVFPQLLGKSFGAAAYRVRAESCSLSIDYEWGVRGSKR